jgi:hypothetical protein
MAMLNNQRVPDMAIELAIFLRKPTALHRSQATPSVTSVEGNVDESLTCQVASTTSSFLKKRQENPGKQIYKLWV